MEYENLSAFLDHIIEDGVITTEEHDRFMEIVHADGEIDEEESKQISRMFQLLSSGQIKIVDQARENAPREQIEKAVEHAVSDQLDQESKSKEFLEESARKAACKEHTAKKSEIQKAVKQVAREQEEGKNKINEFFEKREQKEQARNSNGSNEKNATLKKASDKFNS